MKKAKILAFSLIIVNEISLRIVYGEDELYYNKRIWLNDTIVGDRILLKQA